MHSPRVARRILSAFLMVAAAIAQPGESLAHGMAHQREYHHRTGHDAPHHAAHDSLDSHDSGHAPTAAVESLGVSSPDHGHEHVHASVDDASVRSRLAPQAVAPEIELPASRVRDTAVETPQHRTPLAGAESSTGPPPRLRAPPTR